MSFWLMKTEPDVFSWSDLERAPNSTASWDGVRNYQARNFMRDEFKLNDLVFIYHSRVEPPAIVGIAQVVREAYPDLTALDPESKYSDEKSIRDGLSRWVMVDVKAVARLPNEVSLSQLRETVGLDQMLVTRPGQRLSVQPVKPSEWAIICHLGGLGSYADGKPAHP